MKDELPQAWFAVDDNVVNSLRVRERGGCRWVMGSDAKICSSGWRVRGIASDTVA